MSKQGSTEFRTSYNEILRSNRIDSISDKELLKYVFTFCVSPDEAHKYVKTLYSAYGTLGNIVATPLNELMNLGMPEKIAILLRLIVLQHPMSALESLKKGMVLDSAEKIAPIFVELLAGLSYEKAYMIMLTDKFKFINLVSLADGAVNNVPIHQRLIIDHAVKNKASIIILAHNHPFGVQEPSQMDEMTTVDMYNYCNVAGVTLGEHFVIAEDQWHPVVLYSNIMPITLPRSFYNAQLLDDAIDKCAQL